MPYIDHTKVTTNRNYSKENRGPDLDKMVYFEFNKDDNRYDNEATVIMLKKRIEDLSAECLKYRQLYNLALKENEDLKSLLDNRMSENKTTHLTTVKYINDRHQNLIDSMKAAHEIEIKHLKDLLHHKNEVIS